MVVEPGAGEVVGDSPERRVEILSDCDELHATWTRFGPRREGADLHVHHEHTDLFYVLDGAIAVRLGLEDEIARVPAGTLARVPPNVVHGFRNPDDAEVRYLNLHAPGRQFADYLRAMRDGRPFTYDQHDPPADGGRPIAEARIGGAEVVADRPGLRVSLLADVDEIAVAEVLSDPGGASPPPHVHRRHVESFYVLDGELNFSAGGRELQAEAGTWVQVPAGVPHTFALTGEHRCASSTCTRRAAASATSPARSIGRRPTTSWRRRAPRSIRSPRKKLKRLARLDLPAEPLAPALRQHVELGRPPHRLDVVAVSREQARDLGHAEAARVALELDDRVARRDVALARDGEVEAEEPTLEELGHELVAAHPEPELEARQPRLGDDELGRADPEAVAHVHVAVEQTLGRQVLAEGRRAELELRPLARPQLVELRRVRVDRLLGTAVHAQVGLAVAVQVEPPQRHASGDRLLPDPGADRPAPPEHLAGEADVDGEHPHGGLPAGNICCAGYEFAFVA